MNEIIEKYSKTTLNNLDKENMQKIIDFLVEKKCDYIEDLLEDYLDLFTFSYESFINKFNNLNKKYNNNFLKLASEDMNLLENFYID